MDMVSQKASAFVGYIAQRLRHENFVLIDIGCSGGLDWTWRSFGDRLNAWGFDPNIEEVERLNGVETNPGVKYEAGFVSAPADHPAVLARDGKSYWGRNPWDRLAVARSMAITAEQTRAAANEVKVAANAWQMSRLAEDRHINLPTFLAEKGVSSADFLKLDIDGPDFDILQSLSGMLADVKLIGVGLEVNFCGTGDPTEHAFHNTDLFMKQQGFELFGLSVRPYSAAALPERYTSSFPAQAVSGRPLQGDALYVRDLCSPLWADLAKQYGPHKLLKLAAIFATFGLPDCAAEVLTTHRAAISWLLDVDYALNLLVAQSSHAESGLDYPLLIEAFNRNDPMFYS